MPTYNPTVVYGAPVAVYPGYSTGEHGGHQPDLVRSRHRGGRGHQRRWRCCGWGWNSWGCGWHNSTRGLQPQHLHLEVEHLRQSQQLLQPQRQQLNRDNINNTKSTATTSTTRISIAQTSITAQQFQPDARNSNFNGAALQPEIRSAAVSKSRRATADEPRRSGQSGKVQSAGPGAISRIEASSRATAISRPSGAESPRQFQPAQRTGARLRTAAGSEHRHRRLQQLRPGGNTRTNSARGQQSLEGGTRRRWATARPRRLVRSSPLDSRKVAARAVGADGK